MMTKINNTPQYDILMALADRLYLASYTHAPNAHTPFPYPAAKQSSRSPSKRSSRAQHAPTPVSTQAQQSPVYFSVDKHLLYNAFHADFGPLHIGHLYRFAVMLHEVLGDPENENRPVVFWSNPDSRSTSMDQPSLRVPTSTDNAQVAQMLPVSWLAT